MSLTVNALAYANDTSRGPDAFRYLGPANTLSIKDYVDVWRKAPISTSTSAGKGRSLVKLTRTLTDGTVAVGDGILKVETSLPVGATSAQLQAMITDLATWLLTAAADSILIDQEIVQ